MDVPQTFTRYCLREPNRDLLVQWEGNASNSQEHMVTASTMYEIIELRNKLWPEAIVQEVKFTFGKRF